jgi:GntR family transcriptional regulator / MocR family aminotransferase
MSRIATHITLAGIDLRRNGPQALSTQLYSWFRNAILSGQLRPGYRMPSTRAMAIDWHVSRSTVVTAYEQLLAEGYVEARVGSGTCVARSLPDAMPLRSRPTAKVSSANRRSTAYAPNARLSRRGELLVKHPVRLLSADTAAPEPFASGLPDPKMFPAKLWTRLVGKEWRYRHLELLACRDPSGYGPLRHAVADHIRAARAVQCEADQVLIVSGSQQALDLIARLLVDPGDVVLVEEPGYPGARAAFAAAGASLLALPVDGDGADIESVSREHRSRIAFVTPSHQYPLGVTMTLSRRLALLQWATRTGTWIIEDDYDSDFWYQGKPLPALQGLDGAGRVIYVGSFSKTLFPSLRLGFIVLPHNLVDAFRRARSVIDGHSAMLDQAVLADFISEGHFDRHIRRMRALYEERQRDLVETAREHLQGFLDVKGAAGGMHVVGWLQRGMRDTRAAACAREFGVHVSPLSACCAFRPPPRGGLLLGYAPFSSDRIRASIGRLAAAFRKLART